MLVAAFTAALSHQSFLLQRVCPTSRSVCPRSRTAIGGFRLCSSSSDSIGNGGGSSKGGGKGDSSPPAKEEQPKSEPEAEEVVSETPVAKSSGEISSGGKGEGGKGEGGGGGRRKPSLFQRILKVSGGDKGNKANQETAEAVVKEGSEESTEASSRAIVPAGPRPENFPKVLALPLTRRPLFPGFYAPIHIKDPKLADSLLELRARGTPYVGAFLLKDADKKAKHEKSAEENKDDLKGEALFKRLHEYGTFAQVLNVIRSVDSDGPAQVFLMGHRRLHITGMVSEDPLTVSVEHLKDKPYDESSDIVKATFMEVVASLRDLMRYNPLYKETIQVFVQNMGNSHINAARLADFGSALTTADEPLLQEVLEQLDVEQRLTLALTLLKKELELAKLQATIAKNVEEKITGDQRRFFLMEQLKAIKKELGLEADDKTALTVKFKERLEPNRKGCPEHVLQVIDEELSKLQGLESSSSEFNVTRNYLDWLTCLPWGRYSQENFDVGQAQKILDEDHYGLSDVKERILEFIAVGKLRGTAVGKIICLSGPPGVGKTSIGKSIAKALDRKFFRFSVGGLSDVAEIKGHRRTYVGAMPGKMVQCLKTTGTANPLVLIDEIDKLGRGHSGDPASALLELLDPEQNANFLDHYLDVTIDLSKVLFVCTANLIENIPAPLLDRMEVIRLVGYITDEKMHIARDYLEKAARESSGIRKEQVEVTDGALHTLIETYCREAGVRNLQKHIEKVYRKIALKIVRRDLENTKKISSDESQKKSTEEIVDPAQVVEEIKHVIEVPTIRLKVHDEVSEKEMVDNVVLKKVMGLGAGDIMDVEIVDPAEVASDRVTAKSSENQSELLEDQAVVLSEEQTEPSGDKLVVDVATEILDDPATPAEVVDEEKLTAICERVSTGDMERPPADEKIEDRKLSDSGAVAGKEGESITEAEKITVDESNLHEYVGNPVFQSDRLYEHTPVGVVMGLAWTAMGGSTLYVETSIVEEGEGKGGLQLTGQLGDVMKESGTIAHTVARKLLRDIDPANQFFAASKLHLHVPAGATPKDGPSAGCTMITSMLSLAMNKAVKKDVAMTGEVTLTGRVLPIGGVKEKTVASRRSGVKEVIFPLANKRDYDEVLPHVKEGIQAHFVEDYKQIYDLVFEKPDTDSKSDSDSKPEQAEAKTDDTSGK